MGVEASSSKAVLEKTFKGYLLRLLLLLVGQLQDSSSIWGSAPLTEGTSGSRTHVLEVIHHLIKEYSITKWFLTVKGRAMEKKSL